MKKLILALVALFTITVSAKAMSYEQARQQALFLTDKMAYELNLTEDQYEAAYEINLDYLMGVNSYNDLFGTYWEQRNLDLSYILLDWQYRNYLDAKYFYRPLYWDGGYWHFGIYARYPHRNYYYFGRPHFYTVYRGGHSWRYNGGRSWYRGRSYGHSDRSFGMRERYNNGHYRDNRRGNAINSSNGRYNNNENRHFGNMERRRYDTSSNTQVRQSSTRTTVNNASRNRTFGSREYNNNRDSNSGNRNVFGGGNIGSQNRSSSSNRSFGNGSSFGGSRGGNFGGGTSRSNSASRSSSSSSNSGGHFGGHR